MKKLGFIFLFTTVVFLCTINIYAKNGDVIGKIYSTDILALINNEPIESYNIGGRTVIITEDLINEGYGFVGNYNDSKRLLTIDSYDYGKGNGKGAERGTVGSVVGNVYDTDIKVIFNGSSVKGYNIGGRTAVCIEDLGEMDYGINSSYGYSKYMGKASWNEKTRTVTLDTLASNYQDIVGANIPSFMFTSTNNVISAKYDPLYLYYSRISIYTGNPYQVDDKFHDSEKYNIQALYLDLNGQQYKIGKWYAWDMSGNNESILHIDDVEKTKELLLDSKPPQKTYNEAIDHLYKIPDYTVIERVDNDNYTVLLLKKTDVYDIVAVKKTGGFVLLDQVRENGADTKVKIWFSGNEAFYSVYPFGGPHGTTTMQSGYDLDNMKF